MNFKLFDTINQNLSAFFTPNTSIVCPCSFYRLMLQCYCSVVHKCVFIADVMETTQATTLTLPITRIANTLRMAHPKVNGDIPSNHQQKISFTPGGLAQLARNIPQAFYTQKREPVMRMECPCKSHKSTRSQYQANSSPNPCLRR